jgi:hypothetical protein
VTAAKNKEGRQPRRLRRAGKFAWVRQTLGWILFVAGSALALDRLDAIAIRALKEMVNRDGGALNDLGAIPDHFEMAVRACCHSWIKGLLTMAGETEDHMPHQPPLVIIEWVDSGQPVSGWQWLETLDRRRPQRCVSVGFLIQDDEESKVLAPNLSASGGDNEWDQASGLITIPTAAVTKMGRLIVSSPAYQGAASAPLRRAS